MKIRLWKGVVIALLLVTTATIAAESPVAMLQRISNRMISVLEHNKSQLRTPGMVHSIVNKVLVPYVALSQMAASVIGPRYWRSATSSQKRQFINQFKQLVISTYSVAIASYDRDVVRFYPLRGAYGNTVTVRSVIIRRNGQRIPLSYNLIRPGS